MNIKYLNDWAIEVALDLSKITEDEAHEIARLTVSNMVVVARNQSLSIADEERLCGYIGNMQVTHEFDKPLAEQRAANIAIEGSHILRVTGQKNERGEEGLFGHRAALDWHANQPSNKKRSPLIWLYGAEGTKGSRTSWINNIASYEALSDEFKEEINDIQITLGYKQHSYSPSTFFYEHHDTSNPFDLVHTNDAGKVGLYFPFLQIFGMVGKTEKEFNSIMTRLREHVLKPEFCYHHDWQDGDVVLSEQWLSIHKRWEFDHMDRRVLHRIALDYENVPLKYYESVPDSR